MWSDPQRHFLLHASVLPGRASAAARKRCNSAMMPPMATIQIRDLPEDTYETIRRRARAHGRSIQAYMHDRIVEFAGSPTKEESVAAIETALARYGGSDATGADIAEDVAAERR